MYCGKRLSSPPAKSSEPQFLDQKFPSRLLPLRPIITAQQHPSSLAKALSEPSGVPLHSNPSSKMSVIIPQESGRTATVGRSTSGYVPGALVDAWRVIGWLGLAFFIMSLLDLAMGWYPLGFGKPEWEFGTISATISGLAIPTLSLYLLFGSVIAREQAAAIKAVAIVMIVFALILAALAVLYLTSVPLALRAVASNPIIHLGMKKAVVKSLMLFAGYEVLFIAGAFKGLRRRAAT